MAVLLLAAASKVPFYFAGGIFAVWAVVLASIGLTRPAFPDNPRGQRAVIGLSLLLAVLAIGTAILTS
jgi:hypothetical protein